MKFLLTLVTAATLVGLIAANPTGQRSDLTSNFTNIDEVYGNGTTSALEPEPEDTLVEDCYNDSDCDYGHICTNSKCKKGCLHEYDCASSTQKCVAGLCRSYGIDVCLDFGAKCPWHDPDSQCCSGYCQKRKGKIGTGRCRRKVKKEKKKKPKSPKGQESEEMVEE